MLSGADVWQLRARESKEASPLASSHFLTIRKQSIIINWRVGGAQCALHMCNGIRHGTHEYPYYISSFSSMYRKWLLIVFCNVIVDWYLANLYYRITHQFTGRYFLHTRSQSLR